MWTIDQILKDLFPHGIPPEAYRHLDLILEMAARGETAPVPQAIR